MQRSPFTSAECGIELGEIESEGNSTSVTDFSIGLTSKLIDYVEHV